MLCAQCEESARGVCATHHAAMPFIITVFGDDPPRSIVVGGTLWCQVCRPQPEPIAMPELT